MDGRHEGECRKHGVVVDALAVERLVTTKKVFHRPRHDVVNAGLSVRRRRAFVKNKAVLDWPVID